MPDFADQCPIPTVPILADSPGTATRYPVRRIFCVGRNYADHALELGNAVDRDAPIWFTKSPAAVLISGGHFPYPPGTTNCHYEMELVVAIGAPAFRVQPEEAMAAVFGYASGLDMTRRDLQNAAKAKGYPWDTGKDFENSAVIGSITPATSYRPTPERRVTLKLNNELRQDGALGDMTWSIPELIADLSRMYHLGIGDLIFTGTPAGVGPVQVGDALYGQVQGLSPVLLTVGATE